MIPLTIVIPNAKATCPTLDSVEKLINSINPFTINVIVTKGFNAAQARNIGANMTIPEKNNHIVAFMDDDLVFNPKDFISLVNLLPETHGFVDSIGTRIIRRIEFQPFDERFYRAYQEDIEWQMRLIKLGFDAIRCYWAIKEISALNTNNWYKRFLISFNEALLYLLYERSFDKWIQRMFRIGVWKHPLRYLSHAAFWAGLVYYMGVLAFRRQRR
ncbi:MAG: glycosyltransferase family 2 protein [Thaumarchaeota archaeon]|nr:MAG: glycosyltransferase family 2 protein [Nitrososphaerota archaeon]